MTALYLNIACGNTFLQDDLWLNLDFAPVSPAVKQANLLGRLPCQDSSLKLVYSSHFLEHIPYSNVNKFLSECHRVLIREGVIRLVVPDLENICREYLRCRDLGEHEKANFCIIELLDQCVRTKVSGRLGEYLNTIKQNPAKYAHMIEYVKNRTGDDVLHSPAILSLTPQTMLNKVNYSQLKQGAFSSPAVSKPTTSLWGGLQHPQSTVTSALNNRFWCPQYYYSLRQLKLLKELSSPY